MQNGELIYGIISAEELTINERELRRRIGEGFAPQLEKCRKNLLKAAECRTAWVKVPVDFPEEGVCLLGDMKIQSRDLSKNLKGCREVVLMGVTLGIGVDRLLQRLSRVSLADHFITDGLASALAESLCDALDQKIRKELGEGLRFHPRYSPGYGDCSIEVQRPLLQRLQAGTTLGITLNDSYLMTPVKSITAIMGIEK